MAKTRGTLKFYDMNSPEIEATTAGQQTEYKGRKGRGTLTFTEIEPIPMPETTVKPETEEDAASGGGAQKDNKKFDAGQYAGDAGRLFLNGVAEGFAATGAAVENWIGKGLDKLFPGAGFEGSGLFNVLYNGRPDWKWAGENGLVGIKQDREYNQESLQENADRIDSKVLKKAAEFGGDIAYGLGNAAPMAATAMATGGASAAASLTKEGLMKTGAEVVEKSGVLNSLSKAAREMLTSQDYWTSFASEVGMDYYDALDNGATEDEALRYALSSAGLNSVIEIGGGIQKIPEKPTFKTWLKSAHEEGMEEIQQGVVSRLLENVVYKKGNPIASVTDENAVFNPVTALGEYAGGAAVGGILSGGQQLAQRGINDAQYRKAYGNNAQALVDESLELNPDNELAKKAQKKLDAGKKLTGSELRQLVQQNETDMLNGDKAKIQAATEKRLTELGESDNVRQLAEIVARQMAGEELSRDEQMQIDGSKYGKRVLDELNPENVKVDENGNPRDTYESSWTGSIGTSVIDPVTFNRNIGVTGAKYNPETQKLDAIVKDSEGNIQTVPLEEAKASPMQEELFDWAEELKEAGPVMVGAYQATQNLELYAKSFRLAYEYGKAHVPMDYVENSEAVNYLHPVQLKLAYEEGEKAQQRQTQAAEKKIDSGGTRTAAGKKKPAVSLGGATVGGTTYAPVDRKALNRRQWAAVEAMRTFSKATGVAVVFYQSQANEKGRYEGANGFYRDGTIYLDINAGRNSTQDVQETAVLKTAAHELTHFIRQNSPTQYEELKQFVVEKLTREEGISFDDLVTDKQRREYGLSYEEAVDEVVADACEMMLKDSKAVEQLARENRSLAERIRQWIRKWVRSLKAAMEGLTADRPESRAMMQYAQELQEIWDNALVDAARNGRGTVGENAPAENRQSIRETSDGKKYVKADRQVLFGSDPDSWSEQLEDYINGKIRRGQDVQLIAEDGDVILLTSTSAGKLSDNHTSDGRTMSDAAFERKANAAAHIDELVEVSSKGKKTVIDKDARHGDMASGGWNYRTAYFMDFDGKYYKTTISVAEGAGGSIVYNVGKMQERSTPQFGGSSGKTGALRGNASDERSSTRRTLHADDTQSARGGESNAQPKEKVISSTSFSAQRRSEVFEPKPSPKQYMQNSRESQAEISDTEQRQMREYRMSDRDVLRMAAGMAKNDRSNRWAVEDKNRLELLERRMLLLDEINAELAALQEERATILSGRKKSELKGEDRNELIKTENRIQIAKDQIEREEARAFNLVSMDVYKPLLKKARSIVEQDAATRARTEYREKAEERQRYQVLKKRLERTTSEWKRMLLKPTKDRYAPEELVRSCLEVAMMLDESGPREGTKSKYRYETTSDALAYMKKQYDALANSEDQYYRLGYDKELSELVEKLREALDGKAIRDLTYEEAGDVAQVLVSMQGILKDARYQIGNLERISTQELVDSAVRQMLSTPERSKTEAAADAVARQSASVMRNVRRMVQYDENAALYKLFHQLEEGVKKKDRFIMEANKLFDRFAGERMLKSATELKTYHISGVDMNMTEMEVMQLILSAKREQSDKTRHLEGEGFIVPDLKLMRKGKGQDAISKGQELNKTFLKDILQLEDGLDAWAKDYMHTASEFFNGMARNAINEATVQTKHRRMAVTKDYVPYEVDKRTVVKDIDGVKFDATIEGDGMLKSVVAGAQNPLIIRGLNTIVENHIERVGRIYGLAVPIRNFNKAYNAKSQKGQGMSMKEAIDRAWPAADTNLIEQAITDLQTSRERATDDISKLMRKAEGKFVEATLLSNISVTIKQAASYSTAGLYLSQKALFPYQATIAKLFAADNSAFAKKLFAEIDEHTPMHYMRRKGMSMEEAATIAQDNSKVVRWMDKKLPDVANPLKWIQNMDVATTAAIWLATKRQVELDGVKQSDPTYWSRVTELYEKVISETQPMYDSLHRPEVQKNTNEVLRGLMMFRTQPLQNAGILYDAAGELAQAKKNGYPEQIKAANRKFRMAVGSQVASLAVFATMTLLAYAVRNRLGRYRDDEEELTVVSIMKRVLGDMAVNGAQLIAPIGGGLIAGGIEKVITGSSYGGTLSIPTLDAINDWISQMDRVRQDIVKLSEDEEADIVTDSVDFAMDTAGVLGIPAKNAFGILRGIVGNITDLTGHEMSWATDKPDPSMAIVKACFENGHMEKGREVIDQVIQSKMDAGKEEKEARSAVRSSLTAYYKKLYLRAYKKKNEKEMKRIRMVIQGSRMYDDNAADVAAGWVKEWAEEEKKKKSKK